MMTALIRFRPLLDNKKHPDVAKNMRCSIKHHR